MYKLKKDTYNELSGICRLVMQNIRDLEEGSKMDLFDPRISNEEYFLYSSVLKNYNSLGNQLRLTSIYDSLDKLNQRI